MLFSAKKTRVRKKTSKKRSSKRAQKMAWKRPYLLPLSILLIAMGVFMNPQEISENFSEVTVAHHVVENPESDWAVLREEDLLNDYEGIKELEEHYGLNFKREVLEIEKIVNPKGRTLSENEIHSHRGKLTLDEKQLDSMDPSEKIFFTEEISRFLKRYQEFPYFLENAAGDQKRILSMRDLPSQVHEMQEKLALVPVSTDSMDPRFTDPLKGKDLLAKNTNKRISMIESRGKTPKAKHRK